MQKVKASFEPVELATRDGVRDLLRSTVEAVRCGDLAPSVANSIAGLASVAMRLAELEVEAQIAALERDALAAKGHGRRMTLVDGRQG